MSKVKKLIGKKFGLLTVVARVGSDKKGQALWYCKCACGGNTITNTYNLTSGITKGCGCLRGKKKDEVSDRVRNIWNNMKQRCTNPLNPNYKYYGGKGITICEEWYDIHKFNQWALLNGYADNLTIDRIDNNGNYEPSNCRWVAHSDQMKNQTSNRPITFNGETHLISEWADIVGIARRTIQYRLDKGGWTIEQALTIKPHFYNRVNRSG